MNVAVPSWWYATARLYADAERALLPHPKRARSPPRALPDTPRVDIVPAAWGLRLDVDRLADALRVGGAQALPAGDWARAPSRRTVWWRAAPGPETGDWPLAVPRATLERVLRAYLSSRWAGVRIHTPGSPAPGPGPVCRVAWGPGSPMELDRVVAEFFSSSADGRRCVHVWARVDAAA